jgi:hypothetical protein
MSASSSNTREGHRRRISWRVATAILAIAGAAVMIYFITLVFGAVRGHEFAPDTFSRRDFRYYELPLVHLQVSPVRRTVKRNELCRHLIKTGLIAEKASVSRWDLVAAARGERQLSGGDASILWRYLEATDTDGISYWLRWTKQHPKLAKVLWPKVAQAAREELYVLIPEMFRAAWSREDPDNLQNELNAILQSDDEEATSQTPAELPVTQSSLSS